MSNTYPDINIPGTSFVIFLQKEMHTAWLKYALEEIVQVLRRVTSATCPNACKDYVRKTSKCRKNPSKLTSMDYLCEING